MASVDVGNNSLSGMLNLTLLRSSWPSMTVEGGLYTQELMNQGTYLSVSTTGSTVANSWEQWEWSILSVHVSPAAPQKKTRVLRRHQECHLPSLRLRLQFLLQGQGFFWFTKLHLQILTYHLRKGYPSSLLHEWYFDLQSFPATES